MSHAKVKIGSTDILVSPLGLGTVKFGRNQGVKYPSTFSLPSDEDILKLLRVAEELGVNLLDTAPAYGISEERLGKLLTGERQNWVLATKVGEEFYEGRSYHDFTEKHARFSIERSLKRLKTDYLDIVLVHSDGNDKSIILESEVLDYLAEAKQEGLIRSFGMSTKTLEGGLLAISRCDIVMVTYNPNQKDEAPVIDEAFKQKKGVFIKKALASGHIQSLPGSDPIQHAFEFIFKTPGISSVILGTLNSEHLRQAHENIK